MELRALYREDDAVSSVLGVVLMVAVTIILAAVIGTFVLGIGSELTDSSPQTNWEISGNVNPAAGSNSSVLLLHGGGEDVDRSTIEVTIAGNEAYSDGNAAPNFNASPNWPETITSGDRLQLTDSGNEIQSGQKVLIIWQTEDSSTILADQRLG